MDDFDGIVVRKSSTSVMVDPWQKVVFHCQVSIEDLRLDGIVAVDLSIVVNVAVDVVELAIRQFFGIQRFAC